MNFKVKIKTLTSLFIGNGESYYPTDYYIDKKGKTLNFINKSDYLNKIYGGFSYRALMDLVSEGSFNFEQLMAIYTNSCKEDVIEYKIPIDDSHGNIHNSDSAFDYLTKNIKEPFRAPIDCFIRGGLDKLPYIQGSSFKGALKNAVQSYLLDKDENTVRNIKVELADAEKSFEYEHDPKKKENKIINKKIAIVDKYVKRKLTGGFAIDEKKIDTSKDFFRLIHASDFVLSNYNNIKTDLNFVKIIRPNNLNKKSDEPTPMPVLLESICKNVFIFI
jgi:CRISPR type III-A-associated RAMP protein Csm5